MIAIPDEQDGWEDGRGRVYKLVKGNNMKRLFRLILVSAAEAVATTPQLQIFNFEECHVSAVRHIDCVLTILVYQ